MIPKNKFATFSAVSQKLIDIALYSVTFLFRKAILNGQ